MDKQNMLSQDTLQSFISDGTSQAVRDRYASLPEIAATMDFGDLDHNVVVLDTETTGFSFNHDELTQIAAARMDHHVREPGKAHSGRCRAPDRYPR